MAWHVDALMSIAGRVVNEDHAGTAGDFAWVLDGAGLGITARFSGFATDAAWLVAEVSAWLTAQIAASQLPPSLSTLLRDLEKHLATTFGAPDATEPSGGPSACLTIVRRSGRNLELAWIADSVALVPRASGRIEVVTDDRVTPFEARTFAAMHGLPRIGSELPAQAREQIRLNRAFVNQPNGYGVVSPTRPWAHLVRYAVLDFDPTQPVVLMTDGVSRLFDTFGCMTAETLHRRCAEGRARDLLDLLRSVERQDPEATQFTRFKIHDDATLLVARASRSENHASH